MKATIEDLKKGDVVITAIGSVLAEVKILRQPQLAKIGKKVTWYGAPRWMSIPCSIRYETVKHTSTHGHSWTRKYPVIANGDPYTDEKRIDFTDKKCWIIKRES